jgi:hypothetical protein
MNLRDICIFGLLVTLVSVAAACDPQSGAKDTLTKHRQLWADQGISSYQYRLEVNCFCPPEVTGPVIVEVSQNAPISVTYVSSGKPAEGKYFEKYDTIEELFIVIDEAFDREADKIEITYDDIKGFPTRISIDFIEQAADDEIAYVISDFQSRN